VFFQARQGNLPMDMSLIKATHIVWLCSICWRRFLMQNMLSSDGYFHIEFLFLFQNVVQMTSMSSVCPRAI